MDGAQRLYDRLGRAAPMTSAFYRLSGDDLKKFRARMNEPPSSTTTDFSNFRREKRGLMLGFKGLAWRGVEQPPILPKPRPFAAADRRLSPHPGAAGGRRPVVRHAA